MNKQIRNAIMAFAKEKFGYIDDSSELHIFDAFDVAKLNKSSNSGDYEYSALATLGDSVAGLLLCERFYTTERKGEITNKKSQLLQNNVFDEVSKELGLPDYRYDGERFGKQPLEAQFKNDPSALFEAVLGAIYKDLGLDKTKAIWDKEFYPLIEKHRASIAENTEKAEDNAEVERLGFGMLNENTSEIYLCRFKKWNKKAKAKEEISKGVLWFDKSEERGFDEQGLFFYRNSSRGALQEFKSLSGKTPDCVLVYKLTFSDLPKAVNKETDTEYETELVEVKNTANCLCLKTCSSSASGNISTKISPYAVLYFTCDDEINMAIKEFSVQCDMPFLEIPRNSIGNHHIITEK